MSHVLHRLIQRVLHICPVRITLSALVPQPTCPIFIQRASLSLNSRAPSPIFVQRASSASIPHSSCLCHMSQVPYSSSAHAVRASLSGSHATRLIFAECAHTSWLICPRFVQSAMPERIPSIFHSSCSLSPSHSHTHVAVGLPS